jgi:hypothetical protein
VIVYVVCAEVPYDSYHQLVLATLNQKEADNAISEQNAKHEPDCRTQRATWSDFDECFCKRYHKHSVPLKGLMPRIRRFVRAAADLGVLSELSDSTLPA